jgi:hypothetical protein
MAVRLPDFGDLGSFGTGAVNVAPGDVRPTYPTISPEAEARAQLGRGLQTLGAGVGRLGGELQQQTDLVNQSIARADLAPKLSRLQAEIERETEPGKIDVLYSRIPQLLNESSQLISNPRAQEAWRARHLDDITKVQLLAEQRQRDVWSDRFHASIDTKVEEVARDAYQSDDPEKHRQAQETIAGLYGSLAEAGVMPRTKAMEKARGVQTEMVTGHTQWLISQGRYGEADAYLKGRIAANDPGLDPGRAAALANQLRPRVAGERGQKFYDSLKGGAPVGPVQQGSVSPEQVAAAAVRNNADPVLVNTVAGLESGHGANAGAPDKKYAGIFQMGADERQSVGGSATSIGSLDDQLDHGSKFLAGLKGRTGRLLGRDPENWEVYMVHQQGAAGFPALNANRDKLATEVVSAAHILGNVPTALREQAKSWTAGQFLDWWRDRYNREEAKFRGVTAAAVSPAPEGTVTLPEVMVPGPTRIDWRARAQAIENSGLNDEEKQVAFTALGHDKQTQEFGQQEAQSDLLLGIGRGTHNRADIENLYNSGKISPAARTSAHHHFDEVEKQEILKGQYINKVNEAATGGAPLDPKSDFDKKAINFHYDTVSRAWPVDQKNDRSINYAVEHGLMPEQLKSTIRSNLHSSRPELMVRAADTLDKLRNANPALVGELDEETRRQATTLSTYANAGIQPEQAARMSVEAMKVPEAVRKTREAEYDVARGKTEVDRQGADDVWLKQQNNSFWRIDPSNIPGEMRAEFDLVAKDEFGRIGSLEASRRMALDQINKFWGQTRVGGDNRYMRFAPEKAYSVPSLSLNENTQWMNEQLVADLKKGALEDPDRPLTEDRVKLFHDPYRNNPDGRPAYNVWTVNRDGRWDLVRTINPQTQQPEPIRWSPDWERSPEKARRDAEQQRQTESLRGLRRGGVVTPPPDTPLLFPSVPASRPNGAASP